MFLTVQEIKSGNLPIEESEIENYVKELEIVLDDKNILKNQIKMNVPTVQFGKYRGKPATELMNDEQYLDWCNKQSDLIAKHQEVFNYINKNKKSTEKVRKEPETVEQRIQKLEENVEQQRKKLKYMEDELKNIKMLLIKPENQSSDAEEEDEYEEPEEGSTSMKNFLAKFNK